MGDVLPLSEWAFEVAATGVPAGSVMLVPIPHSEQPDGSSLVQIGWYAHPDATGHGYVTEAARAVLEYGLASGLSEIRALTHTDNYPSMKVCDRLGMTYLGITEDWYDDAPSSHYVVRAGEWPGRAGQLNSACPTYSPAATPGGTAKIADEVNFRYSIRASICAIRFCSGMNWVSGSRTNAMKNSPASRPPSASEPSTKL